MITYNQPKLATFNIDSNKYDPKKMEWIQHVEEHIIIGETFDCYTTKYLHSVTGYWNDMGRYKTECTTALGIHKSRLVQWEPIQLKLL
ncbi:MAG: hypothetical protein H7320_13770 [Ferruginibacter sp.]|nr:hypothetical protein [Ferruginibacter sp.]